MQCGRNITHMKDLARKFLQESQNDSRPFLLYIGFFDAHRCEANPKKYGEFNEHILDKVYNKKSGNYGWLCEL